MVRARNDGLHQALSYLRVLMSPVSARQIDDVAGEVAGAATSDHRPFVRQRGLRHPPTITHITDDVRCGHSRVSEEHLVEVRNACDLAQRSGFDSFGRHVDDEVRDAAILGLVRIGTRQQDAVVGELGEAVPHLLAVHDVLIAIEDRPRAQGCEVRARARLAVELAPELLAAEDPIDVPILLFVGAVRDQRRHDHRERNGETADGHVELRHLLVEDDLLQSGTTATAVLLGQSDAGPPAVIERPLPCTRPFELRRGTTPGRRACCAAPTGCRNAARRCARASRTPPHGTRPLRASHLSPRSTPSAPTLHDDRSRPLQ